MSKVESSGQDRAVQESATHVSSTNTPPRLEERDTAMSLYHLLDPEVLANPYPLFHRMRSEDPVHWDPFLHAWVVTRYADVLEVLLSFPRTALLLRRSSTRWDCRP